MTGSGDLQFERAEPTTPGTELSCAGCKRRLDSSYYQVNGRVCCADCKQQIQESWQSGSGASGFLRAFGLGLGAAILGALVYFGIEVLTGYEFGLIAIGVGFLVGHAVKKGSRGRGGLGYQLLAVALTYSAIVATYIPPIIQGLKEQEAQSRVASAPPTAETPVSSEEGGAPPITVTESATTSAAMPATQEQSSSSAAAAENEPVHPLDMLFGLAALFVFACLAPFLAGFQNFMGWIIIAIGLYEAWKINKQAKLDVSGPFSVSARPSGA